MPEVQPQDPIGTQLDTPMEESAGSAQPSRGTKRDADEAGATVEPMDDETAITSLLLSHRKGFLGARHAKRQESPEVLPVCEEQFDIDPETPWYYDDVSGKPLDTQMVQAARGEECQVIQTMGVWEPIPRPKNEKVISTRWVDVNKGDAATQVQVTTCCSRTECEEWTIRDTLERSLCFNATHNSTTDFVYHSGFQEDSEQGWQTDSFGSNYMFDFHRHQEGTLLESC